MKRIIGILVVFAFLGGAAFAVTNGTRPSAATLKANAKRTTVKAADVAALATYALKNKKEGKNVAEQFLKQRGYNNVVASNGINWPCFAEAMGSQSGNTETEIHNSIVNAYLACIERDGLNRQNYL